jgi:hypothetical protein
MPARRSTGKGKEEVADNNPDWATITQLASPVLNDNASSRRSIDLFLHKTKRSDRATVDNLSVTPTVLYPYER